MLDVRIDTSQLGPLQAFCLAAANKLDRVTAVAMTRSAKTAQAAVKAQTPSFINNPTRWTLNSTFVKPATEQRLAVVVGFRDYSSSGIAAAKYLQQQVVGGKRAPKPFERRLQSRGLLGSDEYAVPANNAPAKLNAYGNVSGPAYVQILSRLGAMREAGSLSNRSGSRRSTSKRREADYFVATINGNKAIWARKGKRGIVPVFHFIKQAPSYQARFPVPTIIRTSFDQAFGKEFERAVSEQIAYEARKK
jgi:hypothetical protein